MKKFLNKLFKHYNEGDNQPANFRGTLLSLGDYTEIRESIVKTISAVAKENGENWENAIKYIAVKTQIPLYDVVDIIDMHRPQQFNPIDILAVIKYVAEYFNTTTDYILGLTDRPY